MLWGMRPVRVRRSVDLPDPDAPSRRTRSPGWIARSRGPTAARTLKGYRTSTCCHSAAGVRSGRGGALLTVDCQTGKGAGLVQRLHDIVAKQTAEERAAQAPQHEHGD